MTSQCYVNARAAFSLSRAFITYLALTTLLIVPVNGQKHEKIVADWYDADVQGVAVLLGMMPIEDRDLRELSQQLQGVWSVEEKDLGFGGRRWTFGKGLGYTSINLDAISFHGKVAYYKISIRGSFNEDPWLKDGIVDVWLQNSGPPITWGDRGPYYERKIEETYQAFEAAVERELGPRQYLQVPTTLKAAYDNLTDPISVVHVGASENAAVYQLIGDERVDVLENILRSLNPEGRVTALLALRRLATDGVHLSPKTHVTMDRVLRLDIPITTQAGCIVTTTPSARAAVERQSIE